MCKNCNRFFINFDGSFCQASMCTKRCCFFLNLLDNENIEAYVDMLVIFFFFFFFFFLRVF